ncbi:hypothetical protein J1614_006160 [Plenodomus biglobosus]|nr:hypothetical protein J1614_006160 [Plenodomus biglobosus]
MLPVALCGILFIQVAFGYNFPYESTQLQETDIRSNPDIAFGKPPDGDLPQCKNYPGYEGWPSIAQWDAFNTSLGGALLKGIPPAAACYDGQYKDSTKCANVRPCCKLCEEHQHSFDNQVGKHDRHSQDSLNHCRNTGHDWIGRNTGGGALQVWVHRLKAFEYLPLIKIARYVGQAARVGAALEQHEVYSNMGKANITLLAPGSPTVGAYGGFMQGGGFSYVTSKYGLMADQVLSLEVVTADGRFVHADPEENTDLFYAIRGGGPAYPPTTVARSDFGFQTGPVSSTTTTSVSNETFWKGISIYFSHNLRINDAKGIMWNYISTQAPSRDQPERTFGFTSRITKPGVSVEEMKMLVAPLIKDLRDAGIGLKNPEPLFWKTYADFGTIPGGPTGGTSSIRFGSRLVPRSNLEDTNSEKFINTMLSIRSFVEEGGYNFHSVDYAPTYETAGYPGAESAVSPHLRNAVMHMTGFDTTQYGPELADEQWKASHARLDKYLQKWRDATPGSGAYMNEADVEEPDFQESMYGSAYDRLLRIKKDRDPWALFYAVTAVGGECWVVKGTRGLPTQQGRLCRVEQ